MTNKVLTEEEMFEERLRRLDKQEYLDEKEHRFILANIKACFKETLHQREYIKQLESKIKEYENLMGTPIQDIMKKLKVLEILKEAYYHAIWELYYYRKGYYLQDGSDGYRDMEITKEQYDLIKQWVEEESNGKD